jgi:hypothetical protein
MSGLKRRNKAVTTGRTQAPVPNEANVPKPMGLQRRKVEPIEYKEFPRGGHVPDPPESCAWRKKFEASGKWWTETTFCGFFCRNIDCQAYLAFQRARGGKDRRGK